ncbi:MAG: DUF4214 domain-containing protein, partial [Actinomycetota bacterium]|nr:DUF4214 domain-containing protein [Actinomycetota bacterium]
DNWWGSDSGPYNSENNPLGTGDSVADNVDFYPFLLADPFTSGTAEDDEQNNDQGDDDNNNSDSRDPSDNYGDNTPEDYGNSGNDSPCGNSYFCNTDNFSLNYYFSLYDSPSKGFIKLLYNSILVREPDIEGFNNWVNLLENNIKCASEIAECLFFSEENKPRIKNKDNIEFLEYLYSGILFRNPDNQGFNSWLAIINNSEQRKYLFSSFVSSEEWKNICTEFNINP